MQIDGIEDVSGLGLMLGLKLTNKKSSDIVKEGIKKGVIMLTAKEKVRLLPPLVITYDEIDKAVAIIKSLIEN